MKVQRIVRLVFLVFVMSSIIVPSSMIEAKRTPLGAVQAKISKEYFEAGGKKRAYYLFVPETIKDAKSVPLIVTLHGSGRDGKSLVDEWKEQAKQEGFIVVGPDAKNSQAWQIPEDGPNYLHDLIETIKAKYPINERRVYLFGHSAGANFALLMGLLESEYFAAVAVHAGAMRQESYSYIEHAKRKIPLSIFVGDRDPFFPLALINDTKNALKQGGNDPAVIILKKHDHNYYGVAAKLNPLVWDFFKAKELAQAARYEIYDIR